MFDFGLSTYLKLGALVAVLAIIGLGYWHYTGLVAQVSDLKVELSTVKKDLQTAVDTANANAAQALQADADRQRTVDGLEAAFAQLSASQTRSRAAEQQIDAAPAAADGAVAPVLEGLRKSRFGGGK